MQFFTPQKCKLLISIIIGLFSALLYTFSAPGDGCPWVAWITFIPILLLLKYTTPLFSFLGWFIASFLGWLFTVYWLFPALNIVYGFSISIAVALVLTLVLICCIPYMMVGYLAARYGWINSFLGAFKIASLLTCLIAWMPMIFPGDSSLSQYRSPLTSQVVDIGGTSFLLFLILLVNIFVTQSLIYLYESKRIPLKYWMSPLLIICFMLGYGWCRYNHFEKLAENAISAKIAKIGYVQVNLPGEDLSLYYGEYLLPLEKLNDFHTGVALTKKLIEEAEDLDLILWPEIANNIARNDFEMVKKELFSLLDHSKKGAFIFNGMYPWGGENGSITTGKSAVYLLNKEKEIANPYFKANLIPFSEYLPGEAHFPWLRNFFPGAKRILPGSISEPVVLENKIKVIPFLCYDAIFPRFVSKFAEQKCNLFVSLDDDVHFGPTRASEMHFAAMYYRAIEHRIPLVRVNNGSSSAVVLASGRIPKESETPPFKQSYRIMHVRLGDGTKTIYDAGGFAFPFYLAGIWVVGFLFNKRIKNSTTKIW